MTAKEKILSLLASANATTGTIDADLTDAIRRLIEGYGQGGGDSVKTGSFTPASNTPNINVETGLDSINFFFCWSANAISGPVRWHYAWLVYDDFAKWSYFWSNASGSSVSIVSINVSAYKALCTINGGTVTLTAGNSGSILADEYRWIAM